MKYEMLNIDVDINGSGINIELYFKCLIVQKESNMSIEFDI